MRLLLVFGILSLSLVIGSHAPRLRAAQDAARSSGDNADSDDQKQREAAARFLTVLEKTPRRGTALDRLYGYHVEAGTLDKFVQQFTDRTTKNAQDGTAWMILGLLESQRGRDAAAVTALTEAEKNLPENPLAAYYLGQSLVLVGQPEQAAAAFERAIAKKPPRADLLEMFQALGRVYQRAQKGDQALAVWNRLEKLFPNDQRVQEQIATTLVEEGQPAQALPRFEALAKEVKDEYRAATYRIEAADLKVRLGQSKEALADFEALLARLNPDNWLYRDVRRRIDEVFLRTDDQAGLAAYYETWIGKNADDVEAMGRLARLLAGLGRTPEAQNWLAKALKLAPSRKDLRLAYIEQLLAEKQYGAGIEQYALLAQNDPNNPDILRDWGRLILKDTSRPEGDRKQAAAGVWRKLVTARPKDSLTATQVADLFRQSEMTDEALELYRKAVELSPEAIQYKEYLGEYLHTLKRSDEALGVWREIASGKQRTPENLARLAEVLSGFGYLEEGVTHILEACRLDDDEFKYPLKAADLLSRSEKYDAALKQLDQAEKLADSPENKELVLQQRIRNLQLGDKLEAQVDALQKELAGAGKDQTLAERWYLLARYLEAARKLPEADQAIGKALALDEKSIVYRGTSARIAESSGNLQGAADAYRTLAGIDRRFKTEHLTNVAKLETQLGRTEEALQAGRDLLAAAPGNADNYEFFAQLCFQLGKTEDGLEALRRSVRLNPTEAKGMLTLAGALADQFRTDEAIELYWRAFEKSGELEAKLGVVQKLSDLYLQTNHFDRLVERFERGRREASQEREQTICLAQAYQSAGDYGTARQELERLLTQNTRDTQLLGQLASLAESEGDIAAATKFQQELTTIAPSREHQSRLALLLLRSGEAEQAVALWDELAASEDDPSRVIASLDNLLTHNRRETLLKITGRLLRRQPDNWELLYREGVAMAKDKPAEAAERFLAILALRLPDDERSAHSKARHKSTPGKGQSASTAPAAALADVPLWDRLAAAYKIRSAIGLEQEIRIATGPAVWGPDDFGQARLAALAWLYKLSAKLDIVQEFLVELKKPLDKTDLDVRGLWDWCYLQLVRQNDKELATAARRLSQSGDPHAQWLYLTTIASRTAATGLQARSLLTVQRMQTTTAAGRLLLRRSSSGEVSGPSLLADELDVLVATYQSLNQKRSDLLYDLRSTITGDLLAELQRAGRSVEADAIYQQAVSGADRPEAWLSALQLSAARGDLEVSLNLFGKIAEEQLASARKTGTASESCADFLSALMVSRAAQGATADVFTILERYLSFAQRRTQTEVVARGLKKPKPARTAALRGGLAILIQNGRSWRSVRLDYPLGNDYFDLGGITLLRQADELFRRTEIADEMFAQVRARTAAAPEAERVWWQLALAYLCWWHDEHDQAISELARAVEMAPADAALAIELAELCERRQDASSALAVAEAVVPRDSQMLHERESLVLRMAMRAGQLDQARAAAKRLIGLRLDVAEQLQLAAALRELGMSEDSQTLQSRAHRNAGNSLESLATLMRQYQSEQNVDKAAQVARQIINRSSPVSRTGRTAANRTAVDSIRQQALRVLAQAGQIDALIEQTETQLRAAPSSSALLQRLTELYQSAGRPMKVGDILSRQLEMRPDDAALRCQVAQQFLRSGNNAEAIKHYKIAFEQEPNLLGQHLVAAMALFRQAGKTDELVSLLESVDLSGIGAANASQISLLLMQSDFGNRDAELRLVRKMWDVMPSVYRQQLVMRLTLENSRQSASSSGVYEFLKHVVLSGSGETSANSWSGTDTLLNSFVQRQAGGANQITMESVATRLVGLAAAKETRLSELQQEVVERLESAPDWRGGTVLLTIIHARGGKPALAGPLVEKLLTDRSQPIPANTCWILGQELQNDEQTRPLAITLFERWIDSAPNPQINMSYSPVGQLANLYHQAGRTGDARRLLLKFSGGRPDKWSNFDPLSATVVNLNNVSTIGQHLMNLGFAVDALQVYQQAQDYAARTVSVSPNARNVEQLMQPIRQGFQAARNAVSGKDLEQALPALLENGERHDGPRKRIAVDLLLIIPEYNVPDMKVISPTAEALRAAVERSPEFKSRIQERIAILQERVPDDPSVQVAAGLWALADHQPAAAEEAFDRLAALVDRAPLEDVASETKVSVEQRVAASRWLGTWLIAREYLGSKERSGAAAKLARRAVAAARRQSDRRFALAMLREWGQLALQSGDAQEAESRWEEMVELSLPAPAASVEDSAAPGAAADSEGDGGAAAVARSLILRRPLAPVPTVDQFNQVAEISKMAAANKLPDLSLRAIRQALKSGPPLPARAANDPDTLGGSGATAVRTASGTTLVLNSAGSASVSSGRAQGEQSANAQQMDFKLAKLVQIWKDAGVPAADQYETLAAAVFPSERSEEICLYARSTSTPSRTGSESLARMLVNAAVEARRVDDLKQRIARRQTTRQSSAAAKQILSLLPEGGAQPAP